MAFAAATEWDVRTTGNDANGGGFASGGTDYSQQDTPQVTYADLVIGTPNTTITSALNPFTSEHVGNIINVTGGTGFTVQRVQIISVAAGVATCDKAVGTIGSSGGQGKLGGALATLAAAIAVAVGNNTIHLKAGTYNLTSAVAWNVIGVVKLIGYEAIHGDGGAKPVITTSTSNIFQLTYSNGANPHIVNVKFTNTASGRWAAVTATSGSPYYAYFEKCAFDGVGGAFYATAVIFGVTFIDCEIKNCVSSGVYALGPVELFGCRIHNSIIGVQLTSTDRNLNRLIVSRCLITGNTTSGITMAANGRLTVINSVIAGNASGASLTTPWSVHLVNSIVYGNTTYGINASAGAQATVVQRSNAWGANGTANRNNLPVDATDVTLTADPFTNSAGDDYSLNSAAGGGAACRGAGFQWGS